MSSLARLFSALALVTAVACQKESDDPTASMTATFVAGHLGDAGRCVPEAAGAQPSASAGDQQGAPAFCETDCPEPQPAVCMAPMVTIELKNVGEVDLTGLTVGPVVLFEGDTVLETLDGGDIALAPGGEPFESLRPGETVQLFVSFSLPLGGFDESKPHTVRIELNGVPDGAVEVTTPEISPMPAIVT